MINLQPIYAFVHRIGIMLLTNMAE